MAKDCPKGLSICFHCNQMGHRTAECPQLTQRPVHASAPAALHTTDIRLAKAETPRANGRAFLLTTEEVRAAPDVVAGTYFPYSYYFEISL